MSNPTLDKLYEGLDLTKSFKPDLILAIGGGSVIDYAKGLSVCINDPQQDKVWDKYWVKQLEPNHKIVPVGTILTMVATGSEMNGGSIITNTKVQKKIGKHFTNTSVYPKFSILNPEYTYTVPYSQMVAGIYDIFSHLCEQYFSGNDDNTTDYMIEGLMKGLIHSSLIAIKNPKDYESRSNIMWTSTWALNTLLRKGKVQDWMPHKIAQAIGAITNATHGSCLSAFSYNYYKFLSKYAKDKLIRFAINVWNINPVKLTKTQIINKGLDKLLSWMKQLKVVLHLKELGVNKSNLDKIVDTVTITNTGYKLLTKKEIKNILLKSM